MALVRNDARESSISVCFLCKTEKSTSNDDLQVEVTSHFFLEFELGLYVQVDDLWLHFRIQARDSGDGIALL